MIYPEIKARAKELRKNSTKAEKLLWENLRKRKLNGEKYLRQHPLIYESSKNEYFFFIPDFYCSEIKLAIELDGAIHKSTIMKDKNRDEIINSMGIRVLRIKNEELMDMEAVLSKIRNAM